MPRFLANVHLQCSASIRATIDYVQTNLQ